MTDDDELEAAKRSSERRIKLLTMSTADAIALVADDEMATVGEAEE